MRKQFKTITIGVAIACAIIVFMAIITTSMIDLLANSIKRDKLTFINEIMEQSINTVNSELSVLFEEASILAKEASKEVEKNSSLSETISKIKEANTKYENIGIISSDGMSSDILRKPISVKEKDFFKKAMKGDSGVYIGYVDNNTEKPFYIYTAPIYKQMEIVSVLFATISEDTISKSISLDIFDGDTTTFLVNKDLSTLTIVDKGIMGDTFRGLSSEKNKIENMILKQFETNMLHVGICETADEAYFIGTAPTENENLFLLTLISNNAIMDYERNVTIIVLIFCVTLVVIATGLILYVAFVYSRNTQKMKKARQELQAVIANIPGGVVRFSYDDFLTIKFLNEGLLNLTGYSEYDIKNLHNNSFLNFVHSNDRAALASAIVDQMTTKKTVELNCRLQCNDGNYRWFLFKGVMINDTECEEQNCLCVLTDINETIKAQQELALNMQRYRIVTEQSDNIIFEFNYFDQTIFLSDKWSSKFSSINENIDFRNYAVESGFVHQSDVRKFKEVFDGIQRGDYSYISKDIRLLSNTGSYIWCQVKASGVIDEKGNAIKVIGKISDIDKVKRETDKLKMSAQTDSLTGLLNKGATKVIIENYLKNEGKNGVHALMIIDVDNFKAVNDTLGHLIGDKVLSSVSTGIKVSIRATDICGRIGGDEFLVLIKNACDVNFVANKAKQISRHFLQEVTDGKNVVNISASIGIAIFDHDGSDYTQLLDSADNALYIAKKRGKNQYAFFSETN